MTIFDANAKTYAMFLGGDMGVQEYINPKYPKFKKLADDQIDQHWRETEASHQIDRIQFANADDRLKHIFVSNLQFQIAADSIQGRGPFLLMPAISAPELELCFGEYGRFEQLHSRTYTHIIRSVFNNPEEILNPIPEVLEVLNRVKPLIDAYDRFLKLFWCYKAGLFVKEIELKRALVLCISAMHIMESVQFYASFACTFAFSEMRMFEGVGKQLKFILRDENLHVAINQTIIKYWSQGTDGPEYQALLLELRPQIIDMWKACVESEKLWAKYLFKYGTPLLGLNDKVLGDYVEFKANKRMINVGLEPLTSLDKDPLPWIQRNWVDSSSKQEAPQETEITNYKIGAIDNDTSDLDLSFEGM